MRSKINIGDSITFNWYDRHNFGYGVTRKVIDKTKHCFVVRFRSTKWIVKKEDIVN